VGIFSKQKTVKEVAEEFPKQESFLKLFLFKELVSDTAPEFFSTGNVGLKSEKLELVTRIGQVLNYLFAEDPNDFGDAPAEQIQRVKRIRRTVPEDARQLMMMAGNEDMRRIVVYTLRMRTYFHTFYDGDDWLVGTPEGKRVQAILAEYGPEFPQATSDKDFAKMLKKVVNKYALNEGSGKYGKRQ
jgi:hypothetical protein